MDDMKAVDRKLLWELIKDSRRSDRQLAKTLGVSQPTVTRRRAMIERSFVEGYTAIPNFKKIGFELVAFTFVKSSLKFAGIKAKEEAVRKGKDWVKNQPNIIFTVSGEGMGWDGMCVSFHKDYSDFIKLIRNLKIENSPYISESESFVAALSSRTVQKPLHFKYLEKAE